MFRTASNIKASLFEIGCSAYAILSKLNLNYSLFRPSRVPSLNLSRLHLNILPGARCLRWTRIMCNQNNIGISSIFLVERGSRTACAGRLRDLRELDEPDGCRLLGGIPAEEGSENGNRNGNNSDSGLGRVEDLDVDGSSFIWLL